MRKADQRTLMALKRAPMSPPATPSRAKTRYSTGWQAVSYSTLKRVRPLVFVVLSTESTMAAAMAAVKLLIKVREGKKELT